MACGEVTCATDQHRQAMAQPLEQRLRREELTAGSRQLDCQREPIHALADLDDSGGVRGSHVEVRLDALSAQDEDFYRRILPQLLDRWVGLPWSYRLGQGERRHRILMLARKAQRCA